MGWDFFFLWQKRCHAPLLHARAIYPLCFMNSIYSLKYIRTTALSTRVRWAFETLDSELWVDSRLNIQMDSDAFQHPLNSPSVFTERQTKCSCTIAFLHLNTSPCYCEFDLLMRTNIGKAFHFETIHNGVGGDTMPARDALNYLTHRCRYLNSWTML